MPENDSCMDKSNPKALSEEFIDLEHYRKLVRSYIDMVNIIFCNCFLGIFILNISFIIISDVIKPHYFGLKRW